MSKSKKPKKVKIKSVRYGGYEPDEGLIAPMYVPLIKGLEECAKEWDVPENKLEKDLAYLQVCVQAMGERLDALEAESARLRSMWGGVTHSGQPYWVASVGTRQNTVTA